MRVRIVSLALEELAAAAGYYQGKEHGLGKRFLDEYESAVGRITRHPKSGNEPANTIGAADWTTFRTRFYTLSAKER